MLAAIEHGMVGRVVDTTPTFAFYSAIPDHVWRVAGRVWSRHGRVTYWTQKEACTRPGIY